MPIKPENRARYPKDWKQISLRIRRRARQRCECKGECGLRHARVDGRQIDLPPHLCIPNVKGFRCTAINQQPHPVTGSMVVLTVAHLNHTPEDCREENLKAMCQRCHNAYDAPHRRLNAAATRRAKSPQADMFA